ncbi:kinase-like domain-containing protein [Aspergillus egyptiacus]|nr:kinase-like domain-containing protein [Aspergillus egyptiacus]
MPDIPFAMSMFRPAAEIPSSDSESSSDESDHQLTSREGINNSPSLGTAKSLSKDEGSVEDASGVKDVDADTGSHSNFMTAALLEFFCLTRAAELLNAQHGTHQKYTRDSPEVQYLGKKMYQHKSKFLSSHGVLAEGIENEQWGSTRQQYRDNLDLLGLSALEGLNLNESKPPLTRGNSDIVLRSKVTRSASTQKIASNLRLEGPAGPLDLRERQSTGHAVPTFETFQLDPRRIPRPLPLPGSSPTSFPLFDINPSQPSNRMSRYAVEFSEIRIIGRGSFGEVYHVRNHIDGQDYAVKKIPLSQKRLEQLQCGNENQLENIMKEIRTLARLEHSNVVRYYGAWLEQTHLPRHPFVSQDSPVKLEYDKTQDEGSDSSSGDDSFGIVFEQSQDGQQVSTEDDSIDSHSNSNKPAAALSSEKPLSCSLEEDVESIPRNFGEQTYSQMSTFGATDGDIFSDGLSYDKSQLQLQRRRRAGEALPAVILHIQMSLHPIPLSSYLRQQQSDDTLLRRHCYHLVPSLKLMLNIIAGVDYLHSKGIVHRDLKPANIFLSCTEDRNFKECHPCMATIGKCSKFSHPRIGDFGLVADISHLNASSPGTPVASSSTVPKLNRVVGTEFYCPPFFRGNGVHEAHLISYTIDESLDVYALGVILFELLYRINTKMERQLVLTELTRGLQRHTTDGATRERPVFPSDFEQKVDCGSVVLPSGETVAESLKTCIKGMLELHPLERWRCSAVHKHLQDILDAAEKIAS